MPKGDGEIRKESVSARFFHGEEESNGVGLFAVLTSKHQQTPKSKP